MVFTGFPGNDFRFNVAASRGGWIQGLESSAESIATLPTALGLSGATAARRGTVAHRGGSQARKMGSLGWVGKGWGEMPDIFLVMCFF